MSVHRDLCLFVGFSALFLVSRTVKVIRLISKDSIEDGMLRIGQKKLKLEQDMTACEQGNNTSHSISVTLYFTDR